VDKCSDVSEEHTASIFRANEFGQVDAEVIQTKNCVSYIGWFEGVWQITGMDSWKRG
jgi:hypothetical protein